jgi:hypothetical protein
MERMVERRFDAERGSGGTASARTWSVRGRRLLLEQFEIAGRAVVVWEDLPSAARTGVLNRSAVVLAEH